MGTNHPNRGASSSWERGALNSDGFEEDDESKTIEEESILKDLTSSGIGKGRASQRVSE